MIRAAALLLAATFAPLPAAAQAAPAAATEIDPARLAEARKLIEIMMPPAMREQMVNGIVTSVSQTMTKTLLEDPDIKKLVAERPGAREVVMRFLDRQQKITIDEMRTNLPGMFEAMARAYARRFTVPQMREMGAFFATPTGQLYIAESATILSDPDVAGWMQQTMRRALDRMPGEVSTLQAELKALD